MCFYFDFNDIETQQLKKIIHLLLTQLSIICTSTPQALKQLSFSCTNRKAATDSQHTSGNSAYGQKFDEIFSVLSALDEGNERQ